MPEPDYNFGSDRRCLTCVKRFTRKVELWPPSRLTESLAVEGVRRCVTNLSNMSDAWRKRIAAHCWVTLEGRRLSLLIGADNVALTVLLLVCAITYQSNVQGTVLEPCPRHIVQLNAHGSLRRAVDGTASTSDVFCRLFGTTITTVTSRQSPAQRVCAKSTDPSP